MNDELIKAVDKIEKINKNKLLKETPLKDKEEINGEGFDTLLRDEIDKLKQQKQELEQDKKYINVLLDLYNKESRRKGL